jgi:hypothetical protein
MCIRGIVFQTKLWFLDIWLISLALLTKTSPRLEIELDVSGMRMWRVASVKQLEIKETKHHRFREHISWHTS